MYIVIIGQAWMNEHGYGISYTSDCKPFGRRKDAIKHGYALRDSDDFNLGKVKDAKLVDLLWMSESISEEPEALEAIADEICLEDRAAQWETI